MKKIRIRLKELLDERGMTQKEFAKISGMRESQISVICRNTGTGINKEHLEKIAEVLQITDIRDLIEFKWWAIGDNHGRYQ